MTHRLNLLLLTLAALIGLPFYWLLLSNPSRGAEPHPLSIAHLRALAVQMPGPRPTGLETALVGWKRVPGNFYAAGSGMKRQLFRVMAYRLTVPGTGGIVIDGGTNRRLGKPIELEQVLDAEQSRVDGWMGGADMIMATNERPMHLGGLATFAGRRDAAMAMARARLNRWQVPGVTADDHVAWPETLVLRPAIESRGAVAVAPGVVVIPTGTPTPGSQMIYARLADGREYLLAGDVAPLAVNLTQLRLRSRLLDSEVSAETRAETMRWLVTLRGLKRQAPGLVVVPGHDVEISPEPAQLAGG